MVAAAIMKIDSVRLPASASLRAAFEASATEPTGCMAVVDAEGKFIGSLTSAALGAELRAAGWHCGHASLKDAFDGTDRIGVGSLVDTGAPSVTPETSIDTVAGLLASSAGFVAVVDAEGVLLGTVSNSDIIAGLLSVIGAG